jgi:hypothetical protein
MDRRPGPLDVFKLLRQGIFKHANITNTRQDVDRLGLSPEKWVALSEPQFPK